MKKLIIAFIVLLAAVALGVFAQHTPSNLFITLGSTYIQTTLWFAVAAIIVGVFLLYQVWRILRGAYHIPGRVRHFSQRRRDTKNQQLTQRALCALFEGYWDNCEKYLLKSISAEDHMFFHYLGAAEAAYRQKKYVAGDTYLKKAQRIAQPSEVMALEITRARWQLTMQEYQQALTTLQLLQKVSPKHRFVVNGLKDVYLAMENWQALCDLLPNVRRYGNLSDATLDALEQHVYISLLHQAGSAGSAAENQPTVAVRLDQAWNAVPNRWHESPAIVAVYVKYLIRQAQHKKAEVVLKKALKDHHDPVLLEQYAQLISDDPARQLSRAEEWLKQDEQNTDLLLCLGKLCFELRLWGKAKNYLEAGLKIQPRVNIYPLLGQVLEQLGEKAAALECYKAGLQFVIEHRTSENIVIPIVGAGLVPAR